MNRLEVLLYAGIGVAAYAVLCNRLSAMVQPLRLRWVEEAEELLAGHDISGSMRSEIEAQLKNLLRTRAAWELALVILPTAIFVTAVGLAKSRKAKSNIDAPSGKVGETYTWLLRTSIALRLANSPAASVVFLSMLAVAILFFIPAARLVRSLMAQSFHNNHRGDGHHQAA